MPLSHPRPRWRWALVAAMAATLFTLAPSAPPAAVAASGAQVAIDGRLLQLDVPPRNVGGRLMVPLRAIFEALGARVDFDAGSRTISGTRGYTRILLWPDVAGAQVNGQNVSLDVPPVIVDGRLLVPLRFVSEALGASVRWDASSQTAHIDQAPAGGFGSSLGSGPPTGYGAPWGSGPPAGYGSATGGYGPPTGYGAPTGYGPPVGYGSPGSAPPAGYGSVPGSAPPTGYGSPAVTGPQAAVPALGAGSVVSLLNPLPAPGMAKYVFSRQPCPRLEDLINYLHQYTPTWEQLECHLTGDLQRLPVPQFALHSRILDPETDAQYVPDPPWKDERFVEHYKYQYWLLEKLAADFPINVAALWLNGWPPYLDEQGQFISTPFSFAHHDLRLRSGLVPILLEKKKGRLPVSVMMSYSPGTRWPQFASAAAVRQWTRDYFLPLVEKEAQALERAKVEYYSPFPNEVEVWFASGMQPALNQNLSPAEVLAVAQEFADTVLAAVRRHFSGRIPVGVYANYAVHGDFWDGMNYRGFDELRFTVMPTCDLESAKGYYQKQFTGYKKIIARSGVPWGIGEIDMFPRHFRNCQTDMKAIAADLYGELFKVVDRVTSAPVSLGIDLLNHPSEVERRILDTIRSLQERHQPPRSGRS